jgi:pimeloyl-ACP methyl ester carboxylesterase
MHHKEIYFISGLGADSSVFQSLKLGDYEQVHVQWLPPLEGESLQDYAGRLIEQIQTDDPTLIGLSFGGIVAIEIANRIPTAKVILISSITSRCEIPWYFRLAGMLRLHKLVPTWLLKRANFITYWFFGVKTPEEKQQLAEILARTDDQFLKWAIDKIVTWQNRDMLQNLVRIHGTSDRLLLMGSAKPEYRIDRGGHLMVIDHADEVSKALLQILSQDSPDLQDMSKTAVAEQVEAAIEQEAVSS